MSKKPGLSKTRCVGFDTVSLSSRRDLLCIKSENVWGVAFVVDEQWPQFACIPEYDAAPEKKGGKLVISFAVENGDAVYEVTGRCEHGGCFHASLMHSTYVRTNGVPGRRLSACADPSKQGVP